jgi:hypothetical protein
VRVSRFFLNLFFIVICLIVGIAVWLTLGDNFFIYESKKETFGIQYNEVRKKIGIPVIPPEWYTKNTSVIPNIKYFRFRFWTLPNYWYSQTWSNFNSSPKGRACHKEKEIQRYLKAIDAEIDRFNYIVNDSTEFLLEIKYSYLYHGDSSWSASIIKTMSTKDDYLVNTKDIGLMEADSILAAWKLSR